MSQDLREQLESAIGTSYRFERELGGGGMSRVFLAEEIQLGRQVVIKVLPPEMAAGVNQERFRREVQLSARLQHAHIVPVLAAGSAGELLYYVMPFIEGESLRARLAREGELPIAEAARILRQVTDALGYAHERGVVHRDIKPDNVMLSHGHAMVTDFGVAKAVSQAADTGTTMTSMGMAIGTPAYMSPEQAAGDPHVDHRADLYALGVMGYEMLAGRPVFEAQTAQGLMAAHVTQTPEPISTIRPAVPPGLATAVMRCLEKRAADRWQQAREIVPLLEGAATSGGTGAYTPSSWEHQALSRSPVQVMLRLILAAAVALGLDWLLVQQLGLPDWVLYAGVGLVVVGVPLAFLASRQDRLRARAQLAGTHLTPGAGLQRHLTWQKAKLGGVVGFATLGAVTAVFMLLRLAGVGPFATLVSAGTIGERDPILLAEFENSTSDSTLGVTIGELLRIDLGQSKVIALLDPVRVRSALTRMERADDERITIDLAREIATREGIKAILTGEIRPLGSGYVLSARLVATGSGEVLWAGRQDVASPEVMSAAIDKLSALLREKAGESLRSLRADPPLDQVTTRSTEALQAYVQSDRANDQGDSKQAIALMERALAADSTFAMGWRRLGILLQNAGTDPDRAEVALSTAYRLRDRLSVRERFLAEAAYASYIQKDTAAAIAAYTEVIEQYPDERIALNNLAVIYGQLGRAQEALALYRQSIALGVAPASTFGNVIPLVFKQGGPDSARVMIAKFAEAFPDNPAPRLFMAGLALSTMDVDSARGLLEEFYEEERGSVQWEIQSLNALAEVAGLQGKLADADDWFEQLMRVAVATAPGLADPVETVARAGVLEHRAQGAIQNGVGEAEASRMLDESLRLLPLNRRPAGVRDDYRVAELYARAGEVGKARQIVRGSSGAPVGAVGGSAALGGVAHVESLIALMEGRLDDALAERRKALQAASPACTMCSVFELAEVFDRMGQADSAIYYFEKLLSDKVLGLEHTRHPIVYNRLAELYEARGDRGRAIDYYRQFVDLWKDADPVLQPRVEAARKRILALAGEPG